MPKAARQNDAVEGTDIHIVMIPAPPGPEVPTPLPHPFKGKLTQGCSFNVKIEGANAATLGSIAKNDQNHIPNGPRFLVNPLNQGPVIKGSATVMINGKPAARVGDLVMTCSDPAPLPLSQITKGAEKVEIGG